MNPKRLWQEAKKILDQALDLSTDQRREFLDQACGSNLPLRREVESLLEVDEGLGDFITQPAFTVSAERPDRLAPGDRVGHYRVVRRLARGGMGSVYLAVRADDFQKQVALKVLKPGVGSEDLVRRFHTERQIVATLDHPGIARILDAGTTEDGRPYFVMEHVEGEPITYYCDLHKLSTRDRLALFRRVCGALHCAHQNLIVHRDLKPGNILVTSEGIPKLLDFGIAKPLSPEQVASVTTAPGSLPMTLNYASPEQIRGQPVTTSSDVYSLGVLLYQLLTGRLPCRLGLCGAWETMRVICDEQPTRPSVAVSEEVEIPSPDGCSLRLTAESVSRTRDGDPRRLRRRLAGDVDAIVLKAMDKVPRRRYRSALQLSDDIRRHLTGWPVIARRRTLAYRVGKFLGRHKLRLVAAAVGLALLVAFGVERWLRLQETAEERGRADEMVERVVELVAAAPSGELDAPPVTAAAIVDQMAEELVDELGKRPALRVTLLRGLAGGYASLGSYHRARQLRQDVLKTVRDLHPEDHPETAQAMADLARLLARTGDYEQARKHYRQALAMGRRLGWEKHHLVAWEADLARLLMHEGDYPTAEALLQGGLQTLLGYHGHSHHNVGAIHHDLGVLDLLRGNFDGAGKSLTEALRIVNQTGEATPEAAVVDHTLAQFHQARGKPEQAAPLYEKALAIRREKLGEDHFLVALTKKDLASLRVVRGRTEEAEDLLTEALDVLRSIKGEGDWMIADAESIRGACLVARGEYEAAEPILVSSYETLNDQFGRRDALYVRAALERLVALYRAWGKPDQAAEYEALLLPTDPPLSTNPP